MAALAAARATAREVARVAFAPNLFLLGVPSISMIILSISRCENGDSPSISGAISLFTFLTALSTPFPLYLSPLSRSSIASFLPVDAPEGTEARAVIPLLSVTSTSTVGVPRESRISRPLIFVICILLFLLRGYYGMKTICCFYGFVLV